MTQDKLFTAYKEITNSIQGSLDVRKEIRYNAIEEFQIIHQKLWNVDILYSSQSNQFLRWKHEIYSSDILHQIIRHKKVVIIYCIFINLVKF